MHTPDRSEYVAVVRATRQQIGDAVHDLGVVDVSFATIGDSKWRVKSPDQRSLIAFLHALARRLESETNVAPAHPSLEGWVPCCNQARDEIADGSMMGVFDDETTQRLFGHPGPSVHFASDGGHGGLLKLTYCPFCGQKFKFRSSLERLDHIIGLD